MQIGCEKGGFSGICFGVMKDFTFILTTSSLGNLSQYIQYFLLNLMVIESLNHELFLLLSYSLYYTDIILTCIQIVSRYKKCWSFLWPFFLLSSAFLIYVSRFISYSHNQICRWQNTLIYVQLLQLLQNFNMLLYSLQFRCNNEFISVLIK